MTLRALSILWRYRVWYPLTDPIDRELHDWLGWRLPWRRPAVWVRG